MLYLKYVGKSEFRFVKYLNWSEKFVRFLMKFHNVYLKVIFNVFSV